MTDAGWVDDSFAFQLGRKCLRDDLSVAHHEGISGERGIVQGRTSRPENVRHFAFNDLLGKVKRDRVGWEHIRKNLLEHGPYLRMAFQWAVWRNEHRIGSVIRHDRLDITGLESLPVDGATSFPSVYCWLKPYCTPSPGVVIVADFLPVSAGHGAPAPRLLQGTVVGRANPQRVVESQMSAPLRVSVTPTPHVPFLFHFSFVSRSSVLHLGHEDTAQW